MTPAAPLPEGWVIDLDGVIWRGAAPIAGAASAISRLDEAGVPVLFCTNNSNATLDSYAAKLASHGIAGDGRVISSATAAAEIIEPGERVMVCAGPGVVEAVTVRGAHVGRPGELDGGSVDAVVVGFHREFDYAVIDAALGALLAGARLVATNSDPRFPHETGFAPGCGSLVAAIETAAGVRAEVAGKPNQPMVDLVRRRFGGGVVVGDSPGTDGALAAALGWPFGLVLTGNTGPSDVPADQPENWVATDIAELVDRVGADGDLSVGP